MARLEDLILIGTRAAQPAATAVAEGTLYAVTDESRIERSNAVIWTLYGGSGTGGGGVGLSAGTQSVSTGTVVFSNSNGITFGMSGSRTITASHNALTTQSNQVLSLYAVGNTTQSSTGTQNASTLQFRGAGIASVGVTGGSVVVSVPAAGASVNFSAGTTSTDAGAIVFSNSNGVSFGLNGSTITGSVATSLTNIRVSGGTTSNLLSAITFSNANGVSFGLDGSTMTASVVAGGGLTNINVSAGTTSNLLSALTFSNVNGVSFGLASSTITASVATSLTNVRFSAGTTSNLASAITFANSNGVSFGLDAGTITATVQTNYLTTAALSGDTTKYVQAWELTGNTAGTTSSAQGTKLYFSGGNSLTVSGSSNTIVFSVGNYLTTAMASNRGSDFVAATAGFNGTNASGTIASNSWSVSVAAQTNQTVGLYMSSNTTSSVSSGTVDARSLTFRGMGVASVGYSGGEVIVSVPAGGGGITNINISAGTTSQNLSAVTFANSNGVSFGLNGSVVTAGIATSSSYDVPPSPYGLSTGTMGMNTATSTPMSVWPLRVDAYVSVGVMNMLVSASFVTVGASSGEQTQGLHVGLFTRNVSTLSPYWTQSVSWGVTGNNSTYTINQPTTTNYTGYNTGSTTSAGVNITSQYTGQKVIGFPVNSLLTPGMYWLAVAATKSTSSNNLGLSFSVAGAAIASVFRLGAPMGSLAGAYSTGSDPLAQYLPGWGSWSSAGSVTALPASMGFDLISQQGNSMSLFPVLRFWST